MAHRPARRHERAGPPTGANAGARSAAGSPVSGAGPGATPDPAPAAQHVEPYVHDRAGTRALHFSIGELQSRMRLDDPLALDLEYTRNMMGFLLFCPQPAEIAMIGLGGGSLAKFCHRHLPGSRLQVVEINPHVIALRDEFRLPRDDARLAVLQGDGAHFVRRAAGSIDVLLVDGFDSDGLPARLCSQRFYDDCHRLLRPDGLMVVNLHHGHARFETFLGRIRQRFGPAVLVVDGADLANTIVFAGKGTALLRPLPAGIRRVPGLAAAAAGPLRAAFARVRAAQRAQVQVPVQVQAAVAMACGYDVPAMRIDEPAEQGAMELKTARLTLLIDPDKKAAFEQLCARQDRTASQVVRQLIRDYLALHGVDYVAAATPPAASGPKAPAAPRTRARANRR